MFAERGFASASMSAIASEADLTTGALYGHFEGKAELLLAVVEGALRELPMTRLLEAPDRQEPAGSYLPKMVSEYVSPRLGRLRRLAVEVHIAAGRDKRVAQLVAASNRRVVAAVRETLEQALERDASSTGRDRDHAARLLLVVVMGLAHLDTLDPDLIGDADWIQFLENAMGRMLELPLLPNEGGGAR